jgi:hypothetical protein
LIGIWTTGSSERWVNLELIDSGTYESGSLVSVGLDRQQSSFWVVSASGAFF